MTVTIFLSLVAVLFTLWCTCVVVRDVVSRVIDKVEYKEGNKNCE